MRFIFTRHRCLYNATNEEIDIIWISVNHLQSLDNLERDDVSQEIKIRHPAQSTELPEGVVTREAVISASLYVESHQVHPEALVLSLEEMVGDLLSEDVVVSLPGLGGQTHQEPVQMPGNIDELGVEETFSEGNHREQSSLCLNLINKTDKQQ